MTVKIEAKPNLSRNLC